MNAIKYTPELGNNYLCHLDPTTQKWGDGNNPRSIMEGEGFPLTVYAVVWWPGVLSSTGMDLIPGTPIEGVPVKVQLHAPQDPKLKLTVTGQNATDASGACALNLVFSGGSGNTALMLTVGNSYYFSPIAFTNVAAPVVAKPAAWTEAQLRKAMAEQGWDAIDTNNVFSGPWIIAKNFTEVPGGKGDSELGALQNAVNAAGLKAS